MTELSFEVKMAFQKQFVALCKSPEEILESLTPAKCQLMHMAWGILGEAIENIEAAGAGDIENLVEELGDSEFYAEGFRLWLNENGDFPALNDTAVKMIYTSSQLDPKFEAFPVHARYIIALGHLGDLAKKFVIYNNPTKSEAILLAMYNAWIEQRVLAERLYAELLVDFDECDTNYKGQAITRELILVHNLEKLSGKNGRYADGKYSDEAATDRADKK